MAVRRFLLLAVLAILAVSVGAILYEKRGPTTKPVEPARFGIGDRVRISEPGFWADGVTGTIASPPTAVIQHAGEWHAHVRIVPTTSGPRSFYWVRLDEPRRDGDGDGPYGEAEIIESSLVPWPPPVNREA